MPRKVNKRFNGRQTRAGNFMSDYTTSYAIRYNTPVLNPQKTEVAVVTAAGEIQNEDPATPDHSNRLAWADWAISNSSVAWQAFGWPVSTNATIVAAVTADPSGQSVQDSDVQFVVNSVLPQVIADFVANPPK
jgi:hypothetical protein